MSTYDVTDPPPASSIPFVGREQELQYLINLADTLFSHHSLITAWIEGEAGIGKSRLLQAFTEECRRKEVLVCHLCLYPDTTFSTLSSLSTLFMVNAELRHLLVRPVEPSIPSVMEGLRRLSRLRPLILILEDLHLLEPEGAYDIAQLLKGLAHESLVVLCVARPGSKSARSVLDSLIQEEIELRPLSENAVRTLMGEFGFRDPDSTLVSTFMTATRGFPLLIRTLLPGLTDEENVDSSQLLLKSSVATRNLAAMWTARLDRQSLSGLKRLAVLGEFFSMSAASALLPEAESLIPNLVGRELLIPCHYVSPPDILIGVGNDTPTFRFVHTLLHEALVREASLPECDLCLLLERNVPLYSTVPIQHLQTAAADDLPEDRVDAVLRSLHVATDRLLGTPYVRTLSIMYGAAKTFFERHEGVLGKANLEFHRIAMIIDHLNSMKIASSTQEFLQVLEELLERTREPATFDVAALRLQGLHYSLGSIRWPALDLHEMLDDILSMGERFPELLRNRAYMEPLGNLGITAFAQTHPPRPNGELLTRLYRELDGLLEHEDRDVRLNAMRYAVPWFIMFVRNRDDVQHHNGLLDRVRAELGELPRTAEFFRARLRMVVIVGNASQYAELQTQIPRPLGSDQFAFQIEARLYDLEARAGFGMDPGGLADEIRMLLEEISGLGYIESLRSRYTDLSMALGFVTAEIGGRLGEFQWTESMIEEIGMEPPSPGLDMTILRGDREQTARFFRDERERIPESWKPFHELFRDKAPTNSLIDHATALLRTELTSARHLTFHRAQLALVSALIERLDEKRAAQLRKDLVARIISDLEWLAEHDMVGLMRPILGASSELLPERTFARWSDRCRTMLERNRRLFGWRETEPSDESDKKVLVSIIGDITVTRSGGEPERLSGSRMRFLTGLIAANGLLATPLTTEEFRVAATGRSTVKYSDPETGTLYRSINRLRKILGSSEAILFRKNSSPQFNPDLIRTDLAELVELLEIGRNAAVQMQPRKAYTTAMQLFHTLGDNPAWPGLYDDFFERMRTDLEFRLHDLALSVTHLLRSNNDYEHAEQLLRAVLDTMYDEEILNLLTNTLEKLGKRVDMLRLQWKQGLD